MIRKFPLVSWALLACLALSAPLPARPSVAVAARGVVATLGTGSATLSNPSGVVTDFSGNVYVSDAGNNQIIKIAPDGVTASVLSIAGLSPALSAPRGIALDSAGNLYIADAGNARVVKVNPAGSASVVSTPSITLSAPQGVAVDISGNVFISDTGNNRIVEVTAGGTASVVAMTGLGTALAAPGGIAIDPSGNLFIDSCLKAWRRPRPGCTVSGSSGWGRQGLRQQLYRQ